jgi:cytochrome c oxidase subunit I
VVKRVGADSPKEAGPAEESEYHPPPESGARPVKVRRPEEILRRGYQPAEPDRSLDTEDRGGLERNRRWRTGRPEPSEDERPDED